LLVAEAAALRVALDVTAVPKDPVGAGRYSLELASALSRLPSCALSLVTRRDDGERWRCLVPETEVLAEAPAGRLARLAWEEVVLGGALDRLSSAPEVLHGPHYTLPLRPPCATVVTIHDVTLLDHPEWHEPSKVAYFAWALRRARKADVVICVSDATAERFRERCRPQAAVVVVPHGIDHDRFRPALDELEAAADRARVARLGIRPPYLLHVGTVEPRKDLGRLIAAFDVLAPTHPALSLVLAGKIGWKRGSFDEALSTARHACRVRRLGYVDEDDLPALLRSAAVVAYPSLEEGFGLPALEALACGTPLVTTAGSVMASLAGEAAVLCSPGPPGLLAEALEEALSTGPDALRRRKAGLEIAARHSWDKAAEGHLAAYRLAAGR
jgi:glycosyltransferase involved in cell wall biosynthesis